MVISLDTWIPKIPKFNQIELGKKNVIPFQSPLYAGFFQSVYFCSKAVYELRCFSKRVTKCQNIH